ncbi:unnamed protein product [Schistosoma spindalis]|nr:unnamed protein product [Schistosoma spindale]
MHHWISDLIKGSEFEMIEEDQEKVEALADFWGSFHSGTSSRQRTKPKYRVNKPPLTVDFDQDDVFKALSTLDTEKSTRLDGLHPKILGHIAQYIATPVTVIFNMSLDQIVLPMEWKDAIVTPIHKTGPRQLPSNYRPLSLTSVVVEILKIVKKAIMTFVETNNLLSSEQHGFKKGLSSTTNLLIAREYWTKTLDNGNLVDVVYIHFSKAFDKVSTNRLLLKLENLGIVGPP